jgi:glycosyltransferase involved in cell wall biosynthesis
MIVLALAWATTVALLLVLIDFTIGLRQLRFLRDVPAAGNGPAVSVIVAARDEAAGIEAGLRSLQGLDYPDLEIIVVDDRSTDGTAAILDRMAAEDARLTVAHVHDVPNGWLGKNHALHVGAARARGEILLFTDADVVLEPTTLRRAVSVLQRDTLDHLTAMPDIQVPGVALNAFVTAFGVFFALFTRPWKARDPRSPQHIGVGAFNLIRASAYRAIGTHEAIAMRPDDDLKLGKLVKKHGFRQDVVYGRTFIVVEWYSTLRALIDGLMKNSFASVNYSLWAVAGSTAALLVINVWPFVALFVTGGLTRTLNACSVLLIALIFFTSVRYNGGRWWHMPTYPLAAVLFAYIIWRSALLAVSSGRVTWRGTSYPLDRMRANRV